jgi:serine/threonine-protein kinase
MAIVPSVHELVLRWQELREQGQEVSPEELCTGCPDLLGELRQRVEALLSMEQFLGMSPGSASSLGGPDAPTGKVVCTPGRDLADKGGPPPSIPGYEVQAALGKGGMGVVYLARDPKLHREVAIKVLQDRYHDQLEARRRFLEEAQIGAQLQHPGVVPVYEVEHKGARPYFTMKLVRGGTLSQLLRARRDPTDEAPRFLQIFEQVCQTVAYAHARGVIHRDLKPHNIMVGAFGEVQVMDWGLAKVLRSEEPAAAPLAEGALRTARTQANEAASSTGSVRGTPAYIAPEQARGETGLVDERADVFGLGGILCEILTGRPPYTGDTLDEILRLARIGDTDRARARLDDCNAATELIALCQECLAPEPAARPRDGQAVAEGMRLYHAGIQERIRKAELERTAAQVREQEAKATALAERKARQRTRVLAVAVLLLVLCGAAGAGLVIRQRAAAQAHQEQIDGEALAVLDRASSLLEEGWQAHDPAKLSEARAEGERAADIARSGAAGEDVQQRVAAFQSKAEQRWQRWQKNDALRGYLLEVAAPSETGSYRADESGRLVAADQYSVSDQYAAAFQRWGLDIDRAAESEVLARLRQEPDVLRQDLIAGLDGWMQARWRQQRSMPGWRHLYQITEQLDGDDTRRQLRALLIEAAPPRPQVVAGLVGTASPWTAWWQLAQGSGWWRVQELRGKMDVAGEPVLTIVLLAQVSYAAGDAAGALAMLRQASQLRPNQIVLLNELAQILQDQQRWEEAVGCYRAIRVQRPGLGIGLAVALFRLGRAAEGETVLRDLIQKQSQNPELHFHLGNALMAQNKPAAAEGAFRKSVQLYPHEAAPYYNLGLALSQQKKLPEAEAAFKQAIAFKPDYADAYNQLAVTLKGQGKYADSEAACRKAIKIKPDFAYAYNNLGNALVKQGKHSLAEAAYHQAIDLKPDCAEAYNNLGIALENQNKHEEAENSCRKAIAVKPAYPEAYVELAATLGHQGKSVEAEVACRKAIELKVDFDALNSLGAALNAQGRHKEAEEAFRKAIKLDSDVAVVYRNLGIALAQQAEFGQALAALKKGLDLLPAKDPGRPGFLRLMDVCRQQQGLDARLPAILQGTEIAANAAELIKFGDLCVRKKLFATAARFYGGAFVAAPRLGVPGRSERFSAGRAAALAGWGQDAVKLDAGQRAHWRKHALEWLRADLAWWSKACETGNRTRAAVQQELRHRLADADLGRIRSHDAIDQLPEGERQQWRQFWADVAGLLRKVDTKH